ncbi:MAG: redoxin domain-containing protein [Alphaproteobacteria bacterium]|nr:redoxin domain-containing protein [Alphaproteobacteria bacterium]
MANELREGLKAPAFSLPTDGGGKAQLKDYAGRNLVLYFYPKDDTSGCTKQAISFSEHIADFEAAGAAILGVSADPIAKHDKFKAKHGLSIRLASDEDTTMLARYGVWVEKSMYGKKYMGIERSTFLIGADGKIVRIWRKVKVAGHVEEVLEAARALG